jgi:hypothetical protein
MSKIGYYRFKTDVTDGRVVTLYKNGVEAGTATIVQLDSCPGDRILKFLDSNGQYRFYNFNSFYGVQDNPSLIGTTNEFITSILDAQTNSKNLGYRNDRQLSLTGEVNSDQLTILSDIYTSPRVYLYIGSNNSDQDKDWLEVTIVGGDKTVRRRKAKNGSINLTIQLPEWFTIKSI